MQTKRLYEFGGFRLDAGEGVLYSNGEPVKLTPKAVQTLTLLVERSGHIVTKDEFLETVWADTFVEENALSFNISQLRKTLAQFDGDTKFIETVSRRGFRFTAEVREICPEDDRDEIVFERHSVEEILVEESFETESPAAIDVTPQPQLVLSSQYDKNSRRFYLLSAAAVLLIALATGAFLHFRGDSADSVSANNSVRSIAVLPLTPLDDSEEDKALSLGVKDKLTLSLGSLQKFVVRPTTGKNDADAVDPLATGRKLGVDAVLFGSVQRGADKVRVNLRLLRVDSGAQIWAGSFDEPTADIFKLQDAISNQVTNSLALNLSQSERERLYKRYTENPEAYQAYLRGRFFWNKRVPAEYEKAVAEFQRAIKLDPNYALAYTGLADAYSLIALEYLGKERDAVYQKARAAALKALEMDETLAEAHVSLGWIKRIYEWDWAGSEREFRRAIELNPHSADARQWYALLLVTVGRNDEALAEIKKAQELDPLSIAVMFNFAVVHTAGRDFDGAIAQSNKALEIDGNSFIAKRALILAYLYNGLNAEAVEFVEKNFDRDNMGANITATFTCACFRSGQTSKAGEALKSLEEKAKTKTDGFVNLARGYVCAGRNNEAVALLQKAYEGRDDRLMFINSIREFDSLRGDQRFQTILRGMKLD